MNTLTKALVVGAVVVGAQSVAMNAASATDATWATGKVCAGSVLRFTGVVHNAYTEDLTFRYMASTSWSNTQTVPAGTSAVLDISTTVNPEHDGDITFADNGSTFTSGAHVLLHPPSIHLTWTAGECGVVATSVIPA